MHDQSRVRDLEPRDAAQLLGLMRDLAKFEGYIDDFRVTEAELIRRAFGPAPEFFAVVAESSGGQLSGMAVGYVTAFTYTLKPAVTLKEFYVRPQSRSKGIGRALFASFVARSLTLGARSIRWAVLTDNSAAKKFYRNVGGLLDGKWEPWVMSAEEMHRIVEESSRALSNSRREPIAVAETESAHLRC